MTTISMNERAPLDPTWHAALRRHARLWRAGVVMAISREAQFRANVLATIVVGITQLVVSLIPIFLLFDYAGSVRGWTQGEVLVLIGLHQMMTALLATFVAPNMEELTEAVTEGALDLLLIRPVNTQFFVATRRVRPANLFGVLLGIVLVLIGLARSSGVPDPGAIIAGAVVFAAGFVLLTCAWLAVATCAFWMSSVTAGLLVFQDVMQAGRYPVQFFPRVVRFLLLLVVPWAIATTLPTSALTHGIAWWVPMASVGFAAIAVMLVRAFWRYAIRFYASASS